MGHRPSKFSPRTPEEDAPATDLLAGIVATDSREQSGIWSTASGVLAAYRTEGALASTRATPWISRSSVAAPTRSMSAQPVGDSVNSPRSSWRSSAMCATPPTSGPATGRAGPPTLLALDEVANIAPIPDLPAMVSEGAGQGLLVLACLQDLSQARVRWGSAADGFLSLFGTTVVLRGIADTSTLRDISALAGDREVGDHDDQPVGGPLGPSPSLDVGGEHTPDPPSGRCRGARRGRPSPRPRDGQGGPRGDADAGARVRALA